jgi:Carboxypeptidase regulatory-like domain/TonB dependent receptor-like, beta-barrel/TonB-dependent Receptor Plug Domain
MSLKGTFRKIGFLVFLVFALAVGSYAQRLTGRVTGVVTDEEMNPLPGVTVEISSPALMGGASSETTNAKGGYRFANLPPGKYKIVFKLEGFQAIENENISLSVGSTVTQNVVLKPKTMAEEVTVIAEAPVVDVTKSGLSTSYSKDALEKLPFNRNTYFDIVNQVAGFTTGGGESSSRFMAYGSNSEDNGMYVDGVDLSSPEIGTAWSGPIADMFEEVEVTGIGAAAEYGNFMGAVVNIVTKSGGNRFSGSAVYYGQFKELTGDNNPDPEQWNSFNRISWYDYAFTLGGPIIRDKIWFFGVVQKTEDKSSEFQGDPAFPGFYTGNEQLLKISSQITKNHKLVLSYDHQRGFGYGSADPYNLPETITGEDDPVHIWNAAWTWIINNNSFFELKYAGYYSDYDMLPVYGGSIYEPNHYDGATGVSSQGPYWPWLAILTRNQVNATFSHFAEDFLGGDHELKLGVQYNRGTMDSTGGYGGGKFYYDYGGEPYYLYEWDTNRYGGTVQNIGAFVDDSWKISPRLTVNIGLRYDYHNAYIQPLPLMSNFKETGQMGKGQDDIIVWNDFSPRLGIAYQLTADQKTLLKASYGRYYAYAYMANWEWPGVNAPTKYVYVWNGADWDLVDTVPTEAGFTMDPNSKHPYTDQFSIGIEREILPDLSVGLTGIYKYSADMFGFEDRGATYEQVERVSPDNGQTYLVWNQVSGPETNEFWLTNPKGWEQKYRGLILTLDKRYSHRWMMNASVTWSKADGLNMSSRSSGGYGMSQTLTWYTGNFGEDPNQLINANGPLNLDKRWLIKLSLGYNLPLDILVSLNYLYQSGRPTLKNVRIPDLNQPFVVSIQAEPKGIERFDDQHLLNLRVEKAFNLYKTAKLRFMVDIFNLLNDATVTNWRSSDVWKSTYKEPSVIPYPRRAQVGVKFEF